MPSPNITDYIRYTLELDAMGTIDDYNQQATIVFIEIVRWNDQRLNYTKYSTLPEITPYHKSHWIDLQTSNDLIWKPHHSYVNQVGMEVQSEQFYLYASGLVDWVRKVSLTVKCQFDFSLFPNDNQQCNIVPYITRYEKSQVDFTAYQVDNPLQVQPTNPVVTTSSAPDTYFSFDIDLSYDGKSTVRNDLDDTENAALTFKLEMKRDPYFYMVYYIVPSVIFVIIAYCSFWISKDSVTARCSLAITVVLITINFQNGINTILPPIEYSVWLNSYFTGILIFTCFAMLEFAVVNFATSNYKVMQQQIDDIVNNIRANLSKYKKKVLKSLESRRMSISFVSNQQKMSFLGLTPKMATPMNNNTPLNNNSMKRPSTFQSAHQAANQETQENLNTEAGLMHQSTGAGLLNANSNQKSPLSMFSLNQKGDIGSLPLKSSNDKFKLQHQKTPAFIQETDKKAVYQDMEEGNIDKLIDEEFKIAEEKNQQQNQSPDTKNSKQVQFQRATSPRTDHKLNNELEDEADGKPKVEIQTTRQLKADDDEEKEQEIYYQLLFTHIEELESAQKDGQNNPAKFQLAFDNFKIFAVKYWHNIDIDFDQKTRKQIEDVFIIENSYMFQVYKFVSETFDYFFRYSYIVSFLIYLCNRLSELYDLTWLYALSIALFISSFFIYAYFLFKARMYDNEWSFKVTFNHYLKFRCIFSRKQVKLIKKDDVLARQRQAQLKNKRS
eukprot:403340633